VAALVGRHDPVGLGRSLRVKRLLGASLRPLAWSGVVGLTVVVVFSASVWGVVWFRQKESESAATTERRQVETQVVRAELLEIMMGSPWLNSQERIDALPSARPGNGSSLLAQASFIRPASPAISQLRRVQQGFIRSMMAGDLAATYVDLLSKDLSSLAKAKLDTTWIGGVSRASFSALAISGTSAGVRVQLSVWEEIAQAARGRPNDDRISVIRARVDEDATLECLRSGWREVSVQRYVHLLGKPTVVKAGG